MGFKDAEELEKVHTLGNKSSLSANTHLANAEILADEQEAGALVWTPEAGTRLEELTTGIIRTEAEVKRIRATKKAKS